ncbi:hypothetical protein BCD67_03040, partial [Oscillatoriales cyanobacterium USR001]
MLKKSQFKPLNGLKLPLICAITFGLLTPSLAAIAVTPPFQVAQVKGCPRATVVESYETNNFFVYICQTQNGAFFYRGLGKDGSQVNVMNVTSGDDGTYYATNNNITYSINRHRLQVTQNDRVILNPHSAP